MALPTRQNGAMWLAMAALALIAVLVAMGFHTKASAPAPAIASRAQNLTDDRAHSARSKKPAIDLSGRQRFGKASFYADRFGGRKMADGQIMDLLGDNAASRTLPLGTTAKVTNLETGQSSIVVIQDRGPYVDGRIVDLSPATAEKIGLTRKQGVIEVAVSPIAVPLPDGRVKSGAAARDPEVATNLAERGRPSGGL